MKITGLEIFKTRESFFYLEKEFFPPLYSIFYSSFDIGTSKMKIPGVYLDQINQVAGIYQMNIDFEVDFIIYDFLSIDEIEVYCQNVYSEDQETIENFIPIAECDSNKTILIGKNIQNMDKVYIENRNLFSDGMRFKILANNIFEFVSKISFTPIENIGYGINNLSQLYKEWNDFDWRVKK